LLNIANETTRIFVLTQGANDSKDRQLMLDKIAFMANVGDHENIVKFIASCNDASEGIVQITSAR